jgi:hypothetical protein
VLLLVYQPREGRSIFYTELALAALALRVVVGSGGGRSRPWPRSRHVLNLCEEIPR